MPLCAHGADAREAVSLASPWQARLKYAYDGDAHQPRGGDDEEALFGLLAVKRRRSAYSWRSGSAINVSMSQRNRY